MTGKQLLFLKKMASANPAVYSQQAFKPDWPAAHDLEINDFSVKEAGAILDALVKAKTGGGWIGGGGGGGHGTPKQIGFALSLALQAGHNWHAKGLAKKYGVPTSGSLAKMTSKQLSSLIDDLKNALE